MTKAEQQTRRQQAAKENFLYKFGQLIDRIHYICGDKQASMKYGFVKIAAAVPQIAVGDCITNADNIVSAAGKAAEAGAELILFPELCVSSGTCGDLMWQQYFIKQCEKAIADIAASTAGHNAIVVAGAPVAFRNAIYNCAIVIHKGKVAGITAKGILCNRNGNDESRHFASGTAIPYGSRTILAGQECAIGTGIIFSTPAFTFGIEIGSESLAPITPGAHLATAGAEIILNPSAMSATAGEHTMLRNSIAVQSRRLKCGYILANSGWGESTSKAVYSGYAALSECGDIIAEAGRFSTESHTTVSEIDFERIRKERMSDTSFTQPGATPYIYIGQEPSEEASLTRTVHPAPFIPEGEERSTYCSEVFTIQATALARRIEHTHSQSAVIGISGGLDSTLALLVAVKAFDIIGKPHSDIISVTMPGFGTTDRTYNNALQLMRQLGTTIKEISIKDACIQHFKDIEHDMQVHDITYENSQARERTQILMDLANRYNGIVIGTGDLSELALGWATYNGDHMSMYGVNASVPKTLIQHIVRWIADTCECKETALLLNDIVETPISPELTPADDNGNIKQKTEDLVGPYELHDFFLYHTLCNGYSPEKIHYLATKAFEGKHDKATIKKWLSTFFWRFTTQQFKRSCMPDSPATGCCSLASGYWSMPSDTSPAMLSIQCKNIDIE